MTQPKEFFYIGYYFSTDNKFMLKIGTTNDLDRRKQEHTRNYHRAKTNTLPQDAEFNYCWYIPLSKYNTLRIEDRTRQELIEKGIGKFVRNDRFMCEEPPDFVEVHINKTYKVPIV